MKTYIHWTVKKFWTLLALTILLVAVAVQLGRQLAPLVSENKGNIEAYFSNILQGQLTSETLELNWSGLLPELRFSQLQLVSPEGREVLAVEGAVARLDLLGSLYHWSPQIRQLHLNGVLAHLSQDEQERWYLIESGEPLEESDDQPVSSATPLDALFGARDVLLNNVVLSYHFFSGREHAFTFNQISLQNHAGFHRLQAVVDLPEQENALQLMLEGEGSLSNWREFSGSGYLHINNYRLRDSVAIASEQVSLWETVRNTRVNADIWLDLVPDKPLTLKGTLQVLRSGEASNTAFPSWIDTDVWGAFKDLDHWQLQLQSLQFENDYNSGTGIDLALQQQGEGHVSFYSPELDLGVLGQFAQESGLVSEPIEGILDSLQLHGYARDLNVLIPRENPIDFKLRANLQDVGANAWKGSPQVAGLKGFLQLDKSSGSVQIDSHDYFLMHFPKLYKQPFEFYRAQGEVAWQYDRQANEIFINSGLLSMDGDIGKVRGYFLMDTPFTAKTRSSDLTLQIGLLESKAVNHRDLVPFTSPENLRSWLSSSIVAGDVPEAGFFYRGSISKGNKNKTLQLGLSVNDGALDYSPGWPALEKFNAELEVDDRLLHGAVSTGTLMASELSNATFSLSDNVLGTGSLLNVQGDLNGPAQDILTVLNESPLQKTLGSGFSQWQLNGGMSARLDLDIPLSAGQPGMAQDIAVALSSVDLTMQDIGLTAESLSGELHYSDKTGLHAKKLEGSLWRQPLQAAIETADLKEEGKETRIHLQTNADMVDLAQWSRRPEIKFMQGVAPIAGVVSIPFSGSKKKPSVPSVSLEFSSDLIGVAVNFAKPFGKPADVAAPLSLQMDIFKSASRYRLNYADLIRADLMAEKGQPIQGEVSLLKTPGSKPRDGLFVTGSLARLHEADLFDFIKRYQSYSDELAASETKAEGGAASRLQFDASVDEFVWGDATLEQLHVGGGQVDTGWLFDLENPWLKGEIGLNQQQPITVSLDYLRIPDFSKEVAGISKETASKETVSNDDAATAKPQTQDFLGQVDLTQLQAMDVSVREVTLAGGDLGRWQFKIRPVPGGVELQDIYGAVRGARLYGSVKEQGASLLWLADKHSHKSRFNGVIEASELGDVLQQWQQPRLLESKQARLSADLSWQGSPVALSLQNISGKVVIDIDKGRFIRDSANTESALLRLLGLLNFDSWVRRLKLDFSDVYKSGLAFDGIHGEAKFEQGMLLLEEPLKVKTPSSALEMAGEIDLRHETLDATMVATLPIGGNATTAAAFFAGLPAAAGVYLISKLLDKQIKKLTSVSYRITGPWASPDVQFDRLFDSAAAQKAGKKARQEKSEPAAAVGESP